MNFIFKTDDVKRMIEHWLNTPPNGYVGVTYGRNLTEFLFHPMDEDRADILLSWLKEDIPVLKNVSENNLMVVSENIGIDSKRFHIKIGEILVPIRDNQSQGVS